MSAEPATKVMLVGHTDAEGPLGQNIELSRARANSVRARLISDYGVSEAQVAADGVGFLMPLAPNTSEEGRQLNRRVEAVLIDTN